MTMPHLMNCAHDDNGWCLECVKTLHAKMELYEDTLATIAGIRYHSLRHTPEEIANNALNGQPFINTTTKCHDCGDDTGNSNYRCSACSDRAHKLQRG